MHADRQRLEEEGGLRVERVQLDERLTRMIDQDVLRPSAVQPGAAWNRVEAGARAVQAQCRLVESHTEVADATGDAGHDVNPVTDGHGLPDAVEAPGVAADLLDDAERFVAEDERVDDAGQVPLPHMRIGPAAAPEFLREQ